MPLPTNALNYDALKLVFLCIIRATISHLSKPEHTFIIVQNNNLYEVGITRNIQWKIEINTRITFHPKFVSKYIL